MTGTGLTSEAEYLESYALVERSRFPVPSTPWTSLSSPFALVSCPCSLCNAVNTPRRESGLYRGVS